MEEYREENESKEKTVTIHKCCLADKHQLDGRMNCETFFIGTKQSLTKNGNNQALN